MLKLFRRILVLIIIIALLDIGFGFLLGRIMDMSPDGRYYKAKYSLEKCEEDLVIFGNSRAETNYAPFVFEDSLNLSCWNTGRGGQTLPFWIAMKNGLLKRYSPKTVIINVESDFLIPNLDEAYERAGFLRPFYYKHPEIRPIIDKISFFEKYLMISQLYSYNSSFYYLLRPFLIKGIDGNRNDKGWKTKSGNIANTENLEIEHINRNNKKINDNTLKEFNNFINSLVDHGCEIYVVISPIYGENIESTSSMEYLESMDMLTVINLGNKSDLYNNPNYFKDPGHLNVQGAIEFSKILSHKILDFKRADNIIR
ncbi:hypothetical protein QWY87_11770 [Lutimonas halocynthiae]|uniref:hypothetical protein n=1 Tax=Lutimonas halocynthiae TaxID=1446477 RepID=UPI0025B56C3E|nr:hypothetical protein [Lutimonas halocynthiae]MDN3643382.1 hypothetical protein [Lutimonas halocynthiae]